MITLNDPKKRLAGEAQNEIVAPFGIDFSTGGGRINVQQSHTGNLIIRKISDDGKAEIITINPKSTNLILIS